MSLKTTFIRRAMEEYMARVIHAVRTDMRRRGMGVTDEAYQSLHGTSTEDGGDLRFRQYLRFVDMGVGASQPLGSLTRVRAVLQASRQTGDVLVKKQTRKAKKVYSKNAYGNLSWLEGKILYGYTQETIDMLKKELEGTP